MAPLSEQADIAEAYAQIAKRLRGLKENKLAHDVCSRAMDKFPRNVNLRIIKSQALISTFKDTENTAFLKSALLELKKVIKLDPQNYIARILASQVLLKGRAYAKARVLLEGVLEAFPDDEKASSLLAIVDKKEGRKPAEKGNGEQTERQMYDSILIAKEQEKAKTADGSARQSAVTVDDGDKQSAEETSATATGAAGASSTEKDSVEEAPAEEKPADKKVAEEKPGKETGAEDTEADEEDDEVEVVVAPGVEESGQENPPTIDEEPLADTEPGSNAWSLDDKLVIDAGEEDDSYQLEVMSSKLTMFSRLEGLKGIFIIDNNGQPFKILNKAGLDENTIPSMVFNLYRTSTMGIHKSGLGSFQRSILTSPIGIMYIINVFYATLAVVVDSKANTKLVEARIQRYLEEVTE